MLNSSKSLFTGCFLVGFGLLSQSSLVSAAPAQAASRKPASVRPDPEIVRKAQALQDQGRTDRAAELLNSAIEKENETPKKSLLHLAEAVIYQRASKDSEAEKEFTAAIEGGGLRVADYAYFERGVLKKKAGKLKEARADFEQVLALKPSPSTETDARYELATISISEKNWKVAAKELGSLKKKIKSGERYDDILFNLMKAERFSGDHASACKAARELFSKFPASPLISEWGPILAKNKIGEEASNCAATQADLKTRIKRLQLNGFAERSVKELQSLKEERGDDSAYDIDVILVNHFISEGQTDEAMKLLMKHYEQEKSHPNYLSLLGKAASRAGDYQAAIGSYQKAYELAPRAANSVNPLFQAAFTSYQIQDYDGATRRFEQLVKVYPRSKLARDAKWHLAWMRYLRGDYEGALDRFKDLAKAPPRKVRKKVGRRWKTVIVAGDSLSNDRLNYWSAMSLLKLGRTQQAIPLFQTLVRDPAIGYYSVLAFYRLLSVPGAKFPPGIETRLGLKTSEGPGAQAAAAPSEAEIQTAEATAETIESNDEGTEVAEGEESGEEAESTEDAVHQAVEGVLTDFSTVGLAVQFERARDLALVGMLAPARRELGEIEKRARKTEDRKLLMAEYAQVEQFYRSSTIGELGFGAQRMRGGLRGESRMFWEFAYPRAWEPAVMQSQRATSVPEELIWGIMRAESHYRSDAQSGVGALGLMQLMPFTGRQVASLLSLNSFQTNSLLEPEVNIRLGSRYLQRLLEKFSGSIPLVAAGYNAGPHRVHAWVRNFGSLDMDEFIEHIPFLETRNYVKKVVRNYQVYSLLYSGGAHSLRWLVQPVGIELDEKVPTKEIW